MFVLLFLLKAKLKSLHEVVVRNRLEQLRKRQRDEALQAQEELLAGVARSASKKTAMDVVVETDAAEEVIPAEDVEPYDRSMSPELVDITKLSPEEREMDILTEQEDRRSLVRHSYNLNKVFPYKLTAVSTTSCCCRFPLCSQSCSACIRN